MPSNRVPLRSGRGWGELGGVDTGGHVGQHR